MADLLVVDAGGVYGANLPALVVTVFAALIKRDVNRVIQAELAAFAAAMELFFFWFLVEINVQTAVFGFLKANVWPLPMLFCGTFLMVVYKRF